MKPTNTILDEIATLLAADSATLAPAALACHVKLIKAPFTPNPNTVVGDFTYADFATSTQLSSTVGAQLTGVDPLTLDRFVEMKSPALGWRWAVTATTNLPQTIYGFCLLDNANAVVYGSALFETPITLTAVGQVIEIDTLKFTFNPNAVS
jgi:hypothetical protein